MKQIQLTKGRHAIVDDDDFDFLNQWKWTYTENKRGYPYALRTQGNTTIRMHRIILNPSKGSLVDHVNGDGLDNRRSNLRICTPAQNQMNRRMNVNSKHGFKGIYFDKKQVVYGNPWVAMIKTNGKRLWLGCFPSKQEAADKYSEASLKYFGTFAYEARNLDKSAR